MTIILNRENPDIIGYCWISQTSRRPIYSARQITRGRDKGMIRVDIRKAGGFKRLIVKASDVVLNHPEGEVKA